jgi:glucosamine-6-phosphate deaminase
MGAPRVESLSVVVTTPEHAAREVAAEIAAIVRERRGAGRGAVIGLAAGRTPLEIYRELARLHREQALSLRGVHAFLLDEYLGLAPEDPRTFRASLRASFLRHVDLDPGLIHAPASDLAEPALDAHCRDYERAIARAGGIDLQILGLGRNGHIGFNEPGSCADSRTRVVALAPETRADAAASFGGAGLVPARAITMGVATILAARRIRLLAFGAAKRGVVARAIGGPAGADVPASFLRGHADARVYLDRESAELLERRP